MLGLPWSTIVARHNVTFDIGVSDLMNASILRVAGAGLIAIAAVACGGAPAGSQLPSGVPTLPPLPSITIPPVDVPSISLTPDQGLEDLFPDDIAGNPLNVNSAQGQSVMALLNEDDPEAFNQFLGGLGATLDQVSAAISFNLWPGATATDFTGLTITAVRVAGVPGTTTITGLVNLVSENIENATASPATVSGKSVTAITNPEDAEETVYLYAAGDVVFLVGGTQSHVEEAFTKLP
jgi:hypothetical protein